MKRAFVSSMITFALYGHFSASALACDMVQLATHMNWCWQVKSHQTSPADASIIRNLIDAAKYGNNSIALSTYFSCASAVNEDARKHQLSCQTASDAFLKAARHVVSCYEPHPSSKFIGYDNPSAAGGLEAGIKLCVRP